MTGDIRGEARIVERAFGLGGSALSAVVHSITQQTGLSAA